MTTPKISVVVPIYKVEECLAWCLDSLLAQDMPDWEGVLVNDGSPDGSRDIAAAYCEKDARFTLVDKENGGLGLLRGLGGGHGSHDHAADAGHVVLGMEQLQRDLGAVLVNGVGQGLKRGDLSVGCQLGRGACGHNGGDVADDDVAHAATGQALVKSQAALANGTVALLVAGGQRRKHNAVLELKGANRNGLEQLGCRCGHGHSSLVGAAAMMPRSCLEDMAWGHSGATEIGRQQVATGGWGGAARRFVSICNSYAVKLGLTVTDRDKPNPPARKSQSITTTRQNPSLVLQI